MKNLSIMLILTAVVILLAELSESKGRIGRGRPYPRRQTPTRRPSRPTRPTRPTQPRSTPPSRPVPTPESSGASGRSGQNQGDDLGFTWANRPGFTNRNPMDTDVDWLNPRQRARRNRADARDRERAQLEEMARVQQRERTEVPVPRHWQDAPENEPMIRQWQRGLGHHRVMNTVEQMPMLGGTLAEFAEAAPGQTEPTAAPRRRLPDRRTTVMPGFEDVSWLRRGFK